MIFEKESDANTTKNKSQHKNHKGLKEKSY